MSNESGEQRGIPVQARIIPPPRTISEAAQRFLSQPNDMAPSPPPPEDIAAWKAHIADGEAEMTKLYKARAAAGAPSTAIEHKLSATVLYEVIPQDLDPALQNRAIFYIHGGGLTVGGGINASYSPMPLAGHTGVRVFSVDYRMPPDHPYPAGLNDVVEAYQLVLERYPPEHIAVIGNSAGGGLAAAFIFKARDQGLPMPVAAVLHTPEADLTESGDTFQTNQNIDVVLKHGLPELIVLYAAGHDLKDPYISPVFGDFSAGFPPTMLTSGTRDLLLSNAVLLHRALLRAGIKAELHVWEAMPHAGFFGAPEDQEVMAEHVRFLKAHLSNAEGQASSTRSGH